MDASVMYDYMREHFQYRNGQFIRKITKGGRRPGTVVGTHDKLGYRVTRIKNKTYRIHRLVWLWHHNSWPKQTIDHINHVRDDNRIENLRDVSHMINQMSIPKVRRGGVASIYT